MKCKNSEIYEFNPIVYPFRLWVGNKLSYDEVCGNFYALSTEMEKMDFTLESYEADRFSVVTCYPVCSKEDGFIGILCDIHKPELFTVGKIAHEASHITDFLSDRLGINGFNFNDGEARAYFTEWAADCIWEVKTNRF